MIIDSLGFSPDSQVLSNAARKATLNEKLNPDEHSNYIRWVLTRMRVFENAHYQTKQGLLEEEVWQGYVMLIFGLVLWCGGVEVQGQKLQLDSMVAFDEFEKPIPFAKLSMMKGSIPGSTEVDNNGYFISCGIQPKGDVLIVTDVDGYKNVSRKFEYGNYFFKIYLPNH